MLYNHLPTTIDDQILLLSTRGMLGDEALIRRWLLTVGYYRLSAYWLPWELPPSSSQTRSKQFKPNTDFAYVVDLYVFDRKLRLLVMEAIDRIEIALRSRWTNRLSLAAGAHAHINVSNFTCGFEHAKLTAKIANTVGRSKETFVEHYKAKYTEPYLPPLWAVTELMTFGELSNWYSQTRDARQKSAVAKDMGLPNRETFEGALQLLAYVRNICAHHGRLWNRRTVKRLPNIKTFKAEIATQRSGNQVQATNTVYNVLVALNHLLLHQSSDTSFPARVTALIGKRPDWQIQQMGFPKDWRKRGVWAACAKQANFFDAFLERARRLLKAV